jgi:AraC family transcriptional regulator of adaptative response / DNA-3-methyladenine glycosylase II
VLTDDACYDAMTTRDPRFDGVFFVGVRTTGIYCRPICPARTPARSRCEFFATPALAERAGFRACFRCRPELAPGNAEVDAVDALVAEAARRIADGALNEASVDVLATELGVSSRHLRRATEAKLGVSPVELAQTRRLALAKQLLQDTDLSLAEIAFAAGFGSVRRFNAMFLERMGSAPSALRRAHVPAPSVAGGPTLRLDFRPPYDWASLIEFLRARAIPGVEHVDGDVYRRVVHIAGATGTIAIRRASRPVRRRAGIDDTGAPGDRAALLMTASPTLLPQLMPLVGRVRRLFDLDARPDVIAAVLRRDRMLARLVDRRPGLRVPGAIDGFEAAIRALLGQQVSVAAATTLSGRFAAAFGERISDDPALSHRFPTAREVAAAGAAKIAQIGLPRARAEAIAALAQADHVKLDTGLDLDRYVGELVELPGIGPWTAHYLAMRALHAPDAFPASDLGLKKVLGNPRDAEARAERWRPFRAYAVMHVWASLSDQE